MNITPKIAMAAIILAHQGDTEHAVELLGCAHTHIAPPWMQRWGLLTRLYADVVVPSGSIIYQIAFTMRKDAVQSGHLMWRWGKPEVQSYGHSAYLYWPTPNIVAEASRETRLLSPSLRVYKVYFLGGSTQVVADNQLTHPPGGVTIGAETTLIQISSRPGDVQRASDVLRRGTRPAMKWTGELRR